MTLDSDVEHRAFIDLALEEARKCTPSPTAFCVGCVITATTLSSPSKAVVIATGYSREHEGNTHAEANALFNLRGVTPSAISALLGTPETVELEELLEMADVYTTMEPCSVRTSGLAPCADALIAAGIRRCFIGVSEPPDFVKCEGADRIKAAGIEVIWVKGRESECLDVARRGH